jgi:hypothetical protein
MQCNAKLLDLRCAAEYPIFRPRHPQDLFHFSSLNALAKTQKNLLCANTNEEF